MEELAEAFEEKTVYPIMHVFLPALIYIYLQEEISRFFLLTSLIYFFETVEYLLGVLIDERWSETKADALVSDIVMAFIGVVAAKVVMQNKKVSTNQGRRWLHVIILCTTTFLLVTFLSDDNNDDKVLSYAIYCGVYCMFAYIFTSREWAFFSAANMILIYAVTTEWFRADFKDAAWYVSTPLACIYVVLPTSVMYSLYRMWKKSGQRRFALPIRKTNYRFEV